MSRSRVASAKQATKFGRKPKTLPKRVIANGQHKTTGAARRRAGKPDNPEHYRNKVSIAVAPEDLAWVTRLAADRNVSVSSIFSEALHMLKRYIDLDALLELMGGISDIPPEVQAEVDAELREAGVIQ
jgi:hypothetical protein